MIPLRDDAADLRSLFAQRRSHPTGPPEECPEPARIWDAVVGALAPDQIADVVDHTARCGACAEDWRLGKRLSEEAGLAVGAEEPAVAPLATRRWLPWAMALAAATVLIAASVLLLRPEREPVYRDAPGLAIRSLLKEDAVLPRQSCVLRWSEPAPQARYDVIVTTEDLVPVAKRSGLTATQYQVPAAALSGLPSGARLAWQVGAALPDGRRVRSRTFIVRLE